MVNSGRVELLMHPLTQKFLEMKWHAYGMYINMIYLLIYVTFLVSVTIFAVGALGGRKVVESAPQNFTEEFAEHHQYSTLKNFSTLTRTSLASEDYMVQVNYLVLFDYMYIYFQTNL